MYLSKQWREGRIVAALAVLGLLLLLLMTVEGTVAVQSLHLNHPDNDGSWTAIFIPIFYVEAMLVAFWGWLVGGIGAGKNLGEDSGSFLFTRPRRRAWFLWTDWGYAMAQIAIIIALANIMIGLLAEHILVLVHSPGMVQLGVQNPPVPLPVLMTILSVGVLLFAGLIYGLTYLCTIALKRAAGVMLAAGVLVAYLVLRGIFHHYYPGVHPPGLIINVFNVAPHSFRGLSGGLGVNIVIRAAIVLAFPAAAQWILERSDI